MAECKTEEFLNLKLNSWNSMRTQITDEFKMKNIQPSWTFNYWKHFSILSLTCEVGIYSELVSCCYYCSLLLRLLLLLTLKLFIASFGPKCRRTSNFSGLRFVYSDWSQSINAWLFKRLTIDYCCVVVPALSNFFSRQTACVVRQKTTNFATFLWWIHRF